jgi:hypothetical protein
VVGDGLDDAVSASVVTVSDGSIDGLASGSPSDDEHAVARTAISTADSADARFIRVPCGGVCRSTLPDSRHYLAVSATQQR